MNPEGSFIWYELMTPDPSAAKRFYDAVVGWTIDPRPTGEMDYRMIVVDGEPVAGVLALGEDMVAGGARPAWLGYFGVPDVDAKAEAIGADGGTIMVPPTDIPGVGRFALLADPAGVPFYIMRGDGPEDSHSFAREGRIGHVAWNELASPDPAEALGFYGRHFGIERTGAMDMGPLGEYTFIGHAGGPIGAVWEAGVGGRTPAWTFYVRVADVGVAADAVRAGGGVVLHGPHTVPTGERVLVASDPQGAVFGLVDAGAGAGVASAA